MFDGLSLFGLRFGLAMKNSINQFSWPTTHQNHPQPKNMGEHGLAIQVQNLQVRVPTSLMKPIGFSPSFCFEICKFWTFRSLAFFFRAFRLLEVLAGAAAYQLKVGDSSEPLRLFETHYNFSWWGNVVVWNWYQNSELGDCQGLIHKPFMMGLPASVNSCFYSSSIGLLFRIEPSELRTATILSWFLLLPCLCLPSRVTTPLQSLQQMRPVASALGAHRLLPDAISIRFPNFVHWLMSLVATRKTAPKNCQKSPQISL